MVDLTTLEGADTAGKVAASVPGPATRSGRSQLPPVRLPSASIPTWSPVPVRTWSQLGVVASVATAFPSGRATLRTKLADRRRCRRGGRRQIDMVIDRAAFLSGHYRLCTTRSSR